MWHLGIDLYRNSLTMAGVSDGGELRPPVRIECLNTDGIVAAVSAFSPFRAVVEATSHYRWLFNLLAPHGTMLLAHPRRLRALTLRRSKTDRLDSQLFAQLLRLDQIPFAYIPAPRFQRLRDMTRQRGRLTHGQTQVKIGLRLLLARHNRPAPYKCPFGPRGLYSVQPAGLRPGGQLQQG